MDNILWVGNHSRLKRHSTFVMYHGCKDKHTLIMVFSDFNHVQAICTRDFEAEGPDALWIADETTGPCRGLSMKQRADCRIHQPA
ncbi:hypothetical protein CRI93_14820 [Longimonas halophila]|uniref:Uncharacterized protein n=1 Tax=Longimonas halophila TaxID=1469170 RepID=A0A2H3NI77_9BACT|nr:hypothetical protein CRI93_14820 [Longimonas halophila]